MMVRVKICGLTNLEDALAAVEYGADALGFVFAPSPRRVTPDAVREIVARLPPFVTKVGVFVNSKLAEIRETMSRCGLDLAQLHGEEGTDLCESLFPRVIKAFNPGNLPPSLERYRAAAIMLDIGRASCPSNGIEQAGVQNLEPLHWTIARDIRCHMILAGGLTPENVAQAIRVAQPYAVDVSSGVEERPGKKDHGKMRDFINAAKGRR
ncbi:MAG: N-(5'-phosphoribosyl)anthranilate isomerase [Dehalococcoidia bacterium]|nr:N-(5'-phosphoribosyl)anthranilate isomerase [Chloroflexota bacterium]